MEKNKTIHIINLNHYLENTPFAQDLLKHNMEMEPNMEWKIWTEKDPEIQEGLASYTGPAKESPAFLAGAYLSHYILYRFGGIYCEMDYEFLQKDFFYRLYEKGDVIINSMSHKYFLNCNCMQIHYFPYPQNPILEKVLQLFNYNQEPLYLSHINNDTETGSYERAIKLGIFSKEELDEIYEREKNRFDGQGKTLIHYQTNVINTCEKIVFIKHSTYMKMKENDKINKLLFENKKVALRIFRDDDFPLINQHNLMPKRYDYGYIVSFDSNLEFMKKLYKVYKKYFKNKVVALDKDFE